MKGFQHKMIMMILIPFSTHVDLSGFQLQSPLHPDAPFPWGQSKQVAALWFPQLTSDAEMPVSLCLYFIEILGRTNSKIFCSYKICIRIWSNYLCNLLKFPTWKQTSNIKTTSLCLVVVQVWYWTFNISFHRNEIFLFNTFALSFDV